MKVNAILNQPSRSKGLRLKNWVQRTWSQKPRWMILTIPMGVLGVAALTVSASISGWLQDATLNLGFLALGVWITVLYVDWAVARHEDQRWTKPRAIAAIRLRRSAAQLVGTVADILRLDEDNARFFVPGWHSRVDPLDFQRELFNNPKWIQFVRDEVLPATKQLEGINDPTDIDWLMVSLQLYRDRIREDLALLQGYLSPKQVEHLSAILDRIPVELRALDIRKDGNPDHFGPDLADIVRRSLELIEESNRNPDTYLPTVDEMLAKEQEVQTET